jgi:hypothetical protein
MAFPEDHGARIFYQILLSEGLAWIGVNIFDQLDGKTFANCELVCKLWRQFITNNGLKFWKRQYLHKLAKPGTIAHGLIQSHPKLFQFDQADQGRFHILILTLQTPICKIPEAFNSIKMKVLIILTNYKNCNSCKSCKQNFNKFQPKSRKIHSKAAERSD